MNKTTRIGVLSRSFSKHPILRSELESRWGNVKFNDSSSTLSGDALTSFLSDCEAAIVALEIISAPMLDLLPRLQTLSKYGVGCDNIDLHACAVRGVRVGWTPGVNRRSVAELTVGFMLALTHEVPASTELVRKGLWQQVRGRQLSERVVGIVGFGHVGQEVATLLRSFGCQMLACDIRDISAAAKTFGVELTSFDTLVRRSDVLTLHVPLTKATRHIVDSSLFAKMPNGSVLINTSRGGVVDEIALCAALDARKIVGAALDVFEVEPPSDTSLAQRANVIATSHIGGSTEEAVLAMGRAAIRGLDEPSDALALLPDYPT